jgi:hypothetical protein
MTTDLPAVEPIEIRLDETTIDRLVERLTESLAALEEANPVVPDEPEKMLSAAEVAERWGVDRSWVYQHSHQLGAIPMGNGRRPRLRFDPEQVARVLTGARQTGRATRRYMARDRCR